MFMPMWMMPKWRKQEVRRRQYWWAPRVDGAVVAAPVEDVLAAVGWVKETPLATMARKTSTLIAMRA